MFSDSENDDTAESSHEQAAAPELAKNKWRPRFTIGNSLLFMAMVGLGAAYFAKSREIETLNKDHTQQVETLKKDYEQRMYQIASFDNWYSNALMFLHSIPRHTEFGSIRVDTSNAWAQSKNEYLIHANLDPTKAYLIHFASGDIPLKGYPAAQKTFYSPAIGEQRNSRNFLLFTVQFLGTGFHYDEKEKPFVGKIKITTTFFNFAHVGATAGYTRDSGWFDQYFLSDELVINKEKSYRDWAEFLLENKTSVATMKPGVPTQLVRIRRDFADPQPRPGVMLWLEELGNASVPEGAIPIKSSGKADFFGQ